MVFALWDVSPLAERSVKVFSTVGGHEAALLRGAIRRTSRRRGDQDVLGDLPSGTGSQLAQLDRSRNWDS